MDEFWVYFWACFIPIGLVLGFIGYKIDIVFSLIDRVEENRRIGLD